MNEDPNIVTNPTFKTVKVNDKWDVDLITHVADLPIWKFWEKERMAAMYAAIRPTDTILDIGTCNGDMSAVFTKWIPRGKMILVEPSPDFWPCIKAIFDKNDLKPYQCYPVLVSNETTESLIPLPFPETPSAVVGSGWPTAANGPIMLETGFAHVNEKPPIPVMRIDEMGLPKIDIITMDIEGTEYEALEGAEKVLLNDRPTVFVSVHPEFMWREHHHSPDDLHVMMQKYGYEGTYLAFDHEQHWMYKPIEQRYGQ